jgi:hypothetical protein
MLWHRTMGRNVVKQMTADDGVPRTRQLPEASSRLQKFIEEFFREIFLDLTRSVRHKIAQTSRRQHCDRQIELDRRV